MSPERLRQQADECEEIARFMSDPRDRDRVLDGKERFLVLAKQEEERRASLEGRLRE